MSAPVIPILLFAGLFGSVAVQGSPGFEVVSLELKRKPRTPGVTLFGQAGLQLRLAMRVAGKSIIAVDTKASRLTVFTDDKKTDLLAAANKSPWGAIREGVRMNDAPQDVVEVTVRSPVLPAKTASRLVIRGKVVARSSGGKKVAKQMIAFKPGAKLEAGPIELTFKRWSEARWGNKKEWHAEFESSKPLTALYSTRFFASGKPLDVEKRGSGRMSAFGKTTYSVSYRFPSKVKGATVELGYHDKMETLTLPVDLTVGIGL